MAEKKLSLEYLKEAVMEPANFWGMAGFAVAAAYTWSPIPLAAALVAEGAYLATVPASSIYRRLVDGRNRNRQAVQNQLAQAERAVEGAPDDRARRIQQANVEILKRRLAQFSELERSVKLVEGQLQSIENFFGLVNDQVVTLPTPERVSSLDFEQLSDSIAMTKQMLEETSDVMGVLDSHNRELGHYDLLPSSGTTSAK